MDPTPLLAPDTARLMSLAALRSPAVLADPYPLFRRLREESPVHRDDLVGGGWLVSRYEDVLALLHDPRLVRNRAGGDSPAAAPEPEELRPLYRAFHRQMLFLDPPDHTRLRGLVSKAFTRRAVEQMRERIQRLVDELLDRVEPAGHMDLIADFAHPLPFSVIRDMLGVPAEDQARLRGWSADYAAFVGNIPPSPDDLARAARSVVEMTEYLRGLLAERRRRPEPDLLTALASAEQEGQVLDEEELVANCLLLLVAGHETTTHWIGNGVLSLLRHPDQMERLRAEPSLLPTAIAELLRFESPVPFTGGKAREDFEHRGQRIRRGDYLFLILGAANRDPAQFPEPDRLDLGRADNRHLAFGHGVHFCLGAPLASLEAEIAFGTLLRRLPKLRSTGEPPRYQLVMGFRGPERLPVAFS
jgi:hypothetical protein